MSEVTDANTTVPVRRCTGRKRASYRTTIYRYPHARRLSDDATRKGSAEQRFEGRIINRL